LRFEDGRGCVDQTENIYTYIYCDIIKECLFFQSVTTINRHKGTFLDGTD